MENVSIGKFLSDNQINHAPPASLEAKRNKLIELAYSVLNHPLHSQHLQAIMAKLGVSENEVIQAYLAYNLDMYAFGNEIYNSIPNKIVLHIHNLMEGSWHQERQDCILDFLKQISAKNIIDIGFGVPSRYIKDFILKESAIKLTLCDIADTALQFAVVLLDQWAPEWQQNICIKQADMCNVREIGAFDAYLFQDSIEHVPDPTACLKEYVNLAPDHANFILSIPIGPMIKAHYMAWNNAEEACIWLKECGLSIINSKKVWINPTVDLFAEQLGNDHHNFMVLCSKN